MSLDVFKPHYVSLAIPDNFPVTVPENLKVPAHPPAQLRVWQLRIAELEEVQECLTLGFGSLVSFRELKGGFKRETETVYVRLHRLDALP